MFFAVCLVTLTFAPAAAQDDEYERRGFDELSAIKIDVDGDGKPDTIRPRTYQIERRVKGKPLRKRDVQNWIAFDLVTSRGRTVKSFFKYKYGTAEYGDSYWVYALKSAGDVDRDGRTDLVFYSGDDTSDETVILANKKNRFVVYQRKVSDSGDWVK
jgi:hypothetical protein